MSRQLRERINLGFVAVFASATALAAALGCSDSGVPKGSTVACEPSISTGCDDVGAACSANAECASGSCAGGACVAADTGAGGNGPGTMPIGDGTGGSFVFVDDLEPSEGGSSGEPSCVDLDVDFSRVTPTVVLLIDQSGSMTQNFDNGLDRWETLVETLTNAQSSLIKKLETSVRFGMSLYTSDNGFGTGATPRECPLLESVDIALGNFSEISTVLGGEQPRGDTPTAESMALVASQLKAFPDEGPKSIILATDGNPDTCEDENENNQPAVKQALSVAAVEAAFADGITTHVISVGNQVTASHLKDLAVAGSGGKQTAEAYQALDTDALVDAFNQIIGSVRTCDFTLEGEVEAADASRGTVILDGEALVFGDPNGWQMPNQTTVRLLGAACEAIQADASGISMSFPCDAIQIIPR